MVTQNELLLYTFLGFLSLLIGTIWTCIFERKHVVKQAQNAIATGESEDIVPEVVDPSREGKLVFTRGKLFAEKPLSDFDFGITVNNALSLIRSVEILQWREHRHESRSRDSQGKETVRVWYTYSKVWSKHHISSALFHNFGHHNPNTLVIGDVYNAQQPQDVKLSAFVLNPSLLETLLKDTNYISVNRVPPISPYMQGVLFGSGIFSHVEAHGEYVYIVVNGFSNIDTVGTLRVTFLTSPTGDVTICSQQSGNSFRPHSFLNDENNFRSKLLARGVEARRNNCFCLCQICLINKQDMDINFELVFRGQLQKEEFFNRDKSNRGETRGWVLFACFLLIWGGFTPLPYMLKMDFKPDYRRYSFLVDGFLGAWIWISINLMIIKWAIDPTKARQKIWIILVSTILLALELFVVLYVTA
eukprot:TRINITY_DN11590_c0_g2_i1.p1 TRINITY_DN11590_c0_g2~~TRINITY_DN11590_c0_g2_i1.p1  ORF type:complete len:416 (+),score=66.17 TRINITY_DN11590_c0_g2_i1:137-1384(+)